MNTVVLLIRLVGMERVEGGRMIHPIPRPCPAPVPENQVSHERFHVSLGDAP